MILLIFFLSRSSAVDTVAGAEEESRTMRILFIGNSYTARHRLPKVVTALAEEGNPGLDVEFTQVIYGGRRLVDHWRLGSANFVRLHALTIEEEKATIAQLEKAIADDTKDRYAKSALGKHRVLLAQLEAESAQQDRQPWDVVVLQSYRDDLDGDDSLYAEYAPKFAELIHAQGARAILYETSPNTQNAEPLTKAPAPDPVMKKERSIAKLADQLGSDTGVAPMSLIALKCQTQRPDLTLRFVNDAHLNHTMAYLTGCAIYSAIFKRSPEGLELNEITDTRFFSDKERDKDRDGNRLTRVFSDKHRASLQRIAWQGWQEFEKLRAE
jgi:hypothetical protein